MSFDSPGPRVFSDQRGNVLICGLLVVLAITVLGLGLFEAGVIESSQVGKTESDVRTFYAAETGLNQAALDASKDNATVLGTVLFDDVKATSGFSQTSPLALAGYTSKCFGGSACSSSSQKTPAYMVQALNSSDADKFWLVSTACLPGPAANPCPSTSTSVAQVRALIKKTISTITTTTTTTTTVPTFTWGLFGGNSVSMSGGTFDSYNSRGCGSPPCQYDATTKSNNTQLGTNGTFTTSGGVTIGGSVIDTIDSNTTSSTNIDVNLSSGTTVTNGIVQSGASIQIGGSVNPATSSQVDAGASGMIKPNTGTSPVTLSALPNCSPYPASLPITRVNSTGNCSYNSATGALNINTGAQCLLTAGSYCVGTVNIQNNGSELRITGPTVLNVNGTFQVQSSAMINNTSHDPQDFQLISTYGNDAGETSGNAVLINSNSSSYMTVYAPMAAILFQGTATLYGAAIGKSVTTTGNSSVHYDTFLGTGNASLTQGIPTTETTTTTTTVPGPTTYALLSWQKCTLKGSSWSCS